MRGTPSIDALLPALYLKGISTGDFSEALAAILGEKASGLSAANIVRLKVGWEADYKAWSQRDLSQKRYVYWWAECIFVHWGSVAPSSFGSAPASLSARLGVGLTRGAALEFVRDGDGFVVTKLDRLARSITDMIAILQALERKRVAVRILNLGMDTQNAYRQANGDGGRGRAI